MAALWIVMLSLIRAGKRKGVITLMVAVYVLDCAMLLYLCQYLRTDGIGELEWIYILWMEKKLTVYTVRQTTQSLILSMFVILACLLEKE